MRKLLLCFLLAVPCFVFGPRVFAQTAERIERLLVQDKVSYRDAALLVLEASGKLDSARQASADEAFSIAMERGWLPPGAEANGEAKLNGLSLLVMQAFEIDGGYLYSFFKTRITPTGPWSTGELYRAEPIRRCLCREICCYTR